MTFTILFLVFRRNLMDRPPRMSLIGSISFSNEKNHFSREKSAPLVPTQMTTNNTSMHKNNRDIGKRLFESGTYKDPRLIYDVRIRESIELLWHQLNEIYSILGFEKS